MTPDGPGPDRGFERDQGAGGYEGPPGPRPTDLPAIFLIVVGSINILLCLYLVFNGVVALSSPEQLQAAIDKLAEYYQGAGQPMPDVFRDPEHFAKSVATVDFIWAGVGIVASLVTVIGGARMYALRSYGLAMTGAVLAAIPCISCTGCCGFGQGMGIWAMVVLARAEVKAMFR
jgi:hypothetical protein